MEQKTSPATVFFPSAKRKTECLNRLECLCCYMLRCCGVMRFPISALLERAAHLVDTSVEGLFILWTSVFLRIVMLPFQLNYAEVT